MNKETALLKEIKNKLEDKFGKDDIDVETKRKVLISTKGSPAQEFDLRIKLKDRSPMFIEIENTQADFSENVAKYWKWLEKVPNTPERILLIHLFVPRTTRKDYLSHKDTAQFIADMAKQRIEYFPKEISQYDAETIYKEILEIMKRIN